MKRHFNITKARSFFLFVSLFAAWMTTPIPGQQDTTSSGAIIFTGRYSSVRDSLRFVRLYETGTALYGRELDSALVFIDSAYGVVRRSITGGVHPDLAQACMVKAYILDDLGRLREAEASYVRALALFRRLFSKTTPVLVQLIRNVGDFYCRVGKPEQGVALLSEAVEISRAVFPGGAELALSLGKAAWCLDAAGQPDRAEPYFLESLSLQRRLHAGDDPGIVQTLFDLGEFYKRRGRYSDAEPLLLEALSMARRLHAGDDENTLAVISATAELFDLRGEYAEAEPLYREALDMSRRLYPRDHPALASTLANMAVFIYQRGRYGEARPLFLENLEILQRLYRSDHPDIARALVMLGTIYEKLDEPEKAERHYLRALNITRRLYPGDSFNTVLALNNLATFYTNQGRFTESEPLLREALDMSIRLFGGKHGTVGIVMGNLAALYEKMNDLAEADRLYAEALAILHAVFETGHIQLLHADRKYADYLAFRGKIREASRYFDFVMKGTVAALHQSFSFESEEQQLTFISAVLKPNLDAFARFCLNHAAAIPSLAERFLDALLSLKGAVAHESARRRLEGSKNLHALAINREITSLRERDALLSSRMQDSTMKARRRALRFKADSLDAVLRRLDREYDKLRRRQNTGWRDVQRQLTFDEALIEFAAIPAGTDSLMYCAVVLKRTGPPAFIALCSEREILPFLPEDISPEQSSYITDAAPARDLYQRLFEPLEPHLEHVRRLFLVPDGILHRIAFGALVSNPAKDSTVYLDARFSIQRLAGGRDLLDRDVRYHPVPYRKPTDFVLVGNPAFSLDSSRQVNVSRSVRGVQRDRESTRGNSDRGSGWAPLPGTEKEIEAIAGICREHNIPFRMITKERAVEESIKALADSSPRVLHLATHGFFFSVQRKAEFTGAFSLSLKRGGNRLRIEDNPMLRSGLVFAGVNRVWNSGRAIPGVDDGILSALEISRLNLTGTELVTLSACQTGLGDIRNGEGIFGLQRAFRAAGVRALIMSLWKVADKPTAEMMAIFYRRWMDGMSKADAFLAARLEMRFRYPAPFIWAAFVLVGE